MTRKQEILAEIEKIQHLIRSENEQIRYADRHDARSTRIVKEYTQEKFLLEQELEGMG